MTVASEEPDESTSEETVGLEGSHFSGDPWIIEALAPHLIDDPIEFIFADHHRQRKASLILNMVAAGDFEETGIGALIKFMKEDFALHIADEELGFFPLLRERCLAEDQIEPLIARLVAEHKDDESVGDTVIALLEKRLAGEKLSYDATRRISAFAEHILQHLAIENAVLLPIARVRMDKASLKVLSGMLKERRATRR